MGIGSSSPQPADLCFLLAQASHALTTELTAQLATLGISPREHCVLNTALGRELTQNRLAELCALDKTTMVVTLDGLERAGLAERRASAQDRRAHVIAVTEAGERVVDKAVQILADTYEDVLGALPEEQRQPFLDGLALLAGGRLARPTECGRQVRRRVPRRANTVQ